MHIENKQLRAFRERARVIALLNSCTCTFPSETFPTLSGHDERCPADYLHRMHELVAKHGEAMSSPIGPKMLRAYAHEMNRIADAAFLSLQGMRGDQLAASVIEDAEVAAARARAVALRLEELAYHLEATR